MKLNYVVKIIAAVGVLLYFGMYMVFLKKAVVSDTHPDVKQIIRYVKISSSSMTDTKAKKRGGQPERKITQNMQCRSYPRHSNQTKNLYFCGIAKVASTFTGTLMNKIQYCRRSKRCWKRKNDHKDTFSFMWAREPYGRLFSAYENKLFHPNDFWDRLGVSIIKRVRNNATDESLRYGHDVTFAEVVKYVINITAEELPINVHLQPMYKSCNPCDSHFDFVGRLETFTEDIGYVCSQLLTMGFLNDTSDCNDVPSTKRLLGRVHKLFEILNNRSNSLSPGDRMKFLQRSWKSYQIRGLLSKTIKMPFTIDNVNDINLGKFSKTLLESMHAFTNKSQLKKQREEALIQAYMTVPLEDMEKLKIFVEKDCRIFGYDLRPEFLFRPREGYRYDYFDGLA